ncbi:MAG: hypothetical protein NTX56_04260 [Proteobacteria bacterium]|nr:hypothetical protein [Pseudomonadota bacterium]
MTTTPDDHELLDASLALLREAQEQIAALIEARAITGNLNTFAGNIDRAKAVKDAADYLSDAIGEFEFIRDSLVDDAAERTPIATAHDARRKDAMAMGDAL